MFIFAGKLLLWLLSFIFINLTNTTTTLAQPAGFLSHFCDNTANYTKNSTYQRNLNTTLSTLPTTNNGFGFYNDTTGLGNDRANSVALCRGDINPDLCLSCLNDSIVKLPQLCPIQKKAIVYYNYCMLRYSDESIPGNPQINFSGYQFNSTSTLTNIDRFNDALGTILNQLIGVAAASGPLQKFASGSIPAPEFSTIYALVQCTPYLSQQQCLNCFDELSKLFPNLFDGRVGATVLLPTCNLRYETYRFYNGSAQAITPPPPPPPPPPPVQFDAIVKLSEENIRRVKEFWKIEENVRSFRAVSVIPSSSQNTEQSHNIMSKKKLFELDDINSMLSIKEEKSGSPAVKSRAGLRSSKKRKTTEVIDLDSQTAGMEKVQEGLKMMAEERRLVYVDLQDVLAQKQIIHEKNAALQQKVLSLNKEIQDLKSSMTLQIDETIENAKHSAIVSILQAKIQMAKEAQEKGLDIWNKQVESWSQALEKIEDKEAAETLEKVAEKEDNTGPSVEAAQKEKDEVEGATAPRVGDEGYNA